MVPGATYDTSHQYFYHFNRVRFTSSGATCESNLPLFRCSGSATYESNNPRFKSSGGTTYEGNNPRFKSSGGATYESSILDSNLVVVPPMRVAS